MYEFVIVLAFVLSITVVPWWLFRRMKAVQKQAYDVVKEERDRHPPESVTTDETVSEADGLALQRRNETNQLLIDADKANAMPDINKTLSGN
ncbi:MAG: hypothetical protein MUE84_14250, partial [Hyphomonas sp.]|nr:hypothetical protein [Hyphomonas sp.]